MKEQAANLYISAVEQGQTNLAIVRHGTDLLYATGRSSEVNQLWSRLPPAASWAAGSRIRPPSPLFGTATSRGH